MNREKVKVIFVFEYPNDSSRIIIWRKLFGFKATYRTGGNPDGKTQVYPGVLGRECRIDQSTILVPREKEKIVEEILKKYAKSYRKFYVVETK